VPSKSVKMTMAFVDSSRFDTCDRIIISLDTFYNEPRIFDLK